MSNQNNGGPAFPSPGVVLPSGQQQGAYEGMTLRQYAAIKLRVPQSGDDWMDYMILEARRLDAAEKAMQGAIAAWTPEQSNFLVPEAVASDAYAFADAMLAAREKGGA